MKVKLTQAEEKEIVLKAEEKVNLMDGAEIAKEAKMIRNTFIFFGVAAFIAGCIIGLINIFSNNEIPGGIGVIVIGLVIALGLVGSTFQKDDALVLNSIKLELRRSLLKEKKEQLEGKEVAFGTFSKSEIESGFAISKTVALKTQQALSNKQSLGSVCKILIDDSNRRVIFQKGESYTKAYNFSDIIKYEIYENNKNVVEGNTGTALIGGLFFGEVGAIIGASGEREIQGRASILKLIIYLNDLNCTQIEYSYLDTEIPKNNPDYLDMIKNLQEISGYLEYIMNNVAATESKSANTDTNTSRTTTKEASKKEQLEELKTLLSDGLISEEDFEKKKNQILGL